jgi:hypothetical protein
MVLVGTTEAGDADNLLIELDRAAAGVGANSIDLGSGFADSTIEGLILNGLSFAESKGLDLVKRSSGSSSSATTMSKKNSRLRNAGKRLRSFFRGLVLVWKCWPSRITGSQYLFLRLEALEDRFLPSTYAGSVSTPLSFEPNVGQTTECWNESERGPWGSSFAVNT